VLGEGVKELGGLHILGTERHESRRIDNQLRGRSGRQGDPGSSRFYLSLEDDLLRIFGSDRISSIMERLGMEEGEPIEANLISRAIENAQKKVEAHNFDIRKHLLEYDDVMNKHREIIYSQRRNILKGEGIDELINDMMEGKIEALTAEHTDPKAYPEDWDIQGLIEGVIRFFGVRPRINAADIGKESFDALTPQTLTELILKQVKEASEARMAGIKKEDLLSVQKMIMLQILDKEWLRHLQDMDHLKEGIGLRGYAQQDPLKEYKKMHLNFSRGLTPG
jgi:preprotein translocase subunit SecA